MKRWGRIAATMIAALLMAALPSSMSGPAAVRAFGTINGLDQRAEHEIITRIALGCAAGVPSTGECFEPISLDQLAGKEGTFGAVGAPDSDDQIFEPEAHCDDADFLDTPGYPQSRAEATRVLQTCIDHLRGEFRDAVDEADDLLDDDDGAIEAREVVIVPNCVFTGGIPGRAKCDVLQGFGRTLHGVQDFYSHSNWADEADPSQPISINNPPGLNLPAPSPLLDMRTRGAVTPPPELSTGFFKGGLPGEDACPAEDGRITHACLNKDKALIRQGPGLSVNGVFVDGLLDVSDPLTLRGKVEANALKAVVGAILESRRQWADFRAELNAKYGEQKGATMARALTQDNPAGGSGRGAAPQAPVAPNLPNLPNLPNIPGLPRP